MIAVRNLAIRMGRFALTNVSLEVPPHAHAVLMGKTGSGKTTLLECICGLRNPASGAIVLCDRDVTQLPPAARGIGYVPQDAALFPSMTVREHLEFPLRLRHWPQPRREQRVAHLAEFLGIESIQDRLPKGLSGGERQRVALGRALSFEPHVLLLDEPLSALDDDTREQICQLLHNVRQETNATVLHITHNRLDAQQLADRRFVLQDSEITEDDIQ